MTKTRRMLKKSEKGETSSSEQAAVVSMELVRYTRVMSGTSIYQSCSVAMPARVRTPAARGWRGRVSELVGQLPPPSRQRDKKRAA